MIDNFEGGAVLKNLTPHEINIYIRRGVCEEVVSIPPSFPTPRVTEVSSPLGTIQGAALVQSTYGPVVDLPPRKGGVWLIVSAMVAGAASDRTDLVSPGDLVRDERGRIVGCRALIAGAGMIRVAGAPCV